MNPHFKDLLSTFNDHNVEFIVVGAHALAAHGHVRAAKDIDLWINPDPENAQRAFHAIKAFPAPLHDLRPSDLSSPGTVFPDWRGRLRLDLRTWPT